MRIGSFWPDTIEIPANTPARILHEQAEHLSMATEGIVEGETTTTVDENRFTTIFYLNVVDLRYRYRLLWINHGPIPYPLNLIFENTTYLCSTEDEFVATLRRILTSEPVVELVRQLVAAAEDH